MEELILFLLNLLIYILFQSIFNRIIKKYIFPFRLSDVLTFIISTGIFLFYILIKNNFYLMYFILLINLNFFYIFYHLQNMINTSPRTKIIIDFSKLKKISFENYLKKYNEKIIVDNRISRLLTNKQIKIVNKKRILYENKKNFIFFISLIFKVIKKI